MSQEKRPEVKGAWLNVFCPEARCLSPEELAALPPELTQAPGVKDSQGLWLKVFCPDESCLVEGETGKPVFKIARDQAGRGLWLSLFCPDDACQIDEVTDLP